MHDAWRAVACGAAGAVVGHGLANAAAWPLVLGALAAWGAAVATGPTRRSRFGLAALGAAAMHAVASTWIYHGIRGQDHLAVPIAVGLTLAFVLVLALLHAAAFGVLERACAPSLAWPLAWVVQEWARQQTEFAFPFSMLGPALLDAPGAGGWMPVVGASGVAALALLALRSWRTAALALPALAAVGTTIARIDWTVPEGAPVSVLVLQTALPQARKWDETAQRTAHAALHGALDAAPAGTVVVTPEMFLLDPAQLTAPVFWDGTRSRLVARDLQLLLGMPYAARDADGAGGIMNAVVHLTPQRLGLYAKERLVPFGEFLPARAALGWVWGDVFAYPLDRQVPAPDELTAPLHVAPHAVGTAVCWEAAFPALMARRAGDAHWLAVVSNDAWFPSRRLRHQAELLTRARAAEQARAVARANNVGLTSVIDARGKVVARLPVGRQAVLMETLQPRSGRTPMSSAAHPALVPALVVVWALAARRFSGRAGGAPRDRALPSD